MNGYADTMRMFLLFSHTLTNTQKTDATECLGVTQLVSLPTNLQLLWSTIPTQIEAPNSIKDTMLHFAEYLLKESKKGDIVLVQGDFGAVFCMVTWCLDNKRVPVYSTTKRRAKEYHNKDGSVELKHTFIHAGFRKYDFIDKV